MELDSPGVCPCVPPAGPSSERVQGCRGTVLHGREYFRDPPLKHIVCGDRPSRLRYRVRREQVPVDLFDQQVDRQ